MVLLVPKREGAQGEKERNLGALRRYGKTPLIQKIGVWPADRRWRMEAKPRI